jgi:AraC-like DNA-binding protein
MKPPSQSAAKTSPEFFSTRVSKARRFYLDMNPAKSRALAVVCGGCEQCTPDYAVTRETFHFYSIEYIARGRGTVKLRGREQPLLPGRLFSYGPGVRHEIVADPAEPMVKYFVDFAGTKARRLLGKCGLTPGQATQVFPPDELRAVFDELIASGLKGSPHSDELCVKLLECLALKIAAGRAPMAEAESLAFATYQQCREHVRQHFMRLKNLQQIAAECHVNGAYLCRLFRRFDHQSPYQFLLRLKMNEAAELLRQPGTLVKQAAELAGFGDPFHFSRAFKSVLGVSPDIFRRLR